MAGQTPFGNPTKITLQVIWNESEAGRHRVVENIRARGLKFGTADDRAFTFYIDSDASEFESLVEQLTNQKAAVYYV